MDWYPAFQWTSAIFLLALWTVALPMALARRGRRPAIPHRASSFFYGGLGIMGAASASLAFQPHIAFRLGLLCWAAGLLGAAALVGRRERAAEQSRTDHMSTDGANQ